MDFFLEFLSKYPMVSMVMFYMSLMRIIFKPLCSLALEVTKATPSPKDEVVVEGFMNGKVYKAVAYALDWVASIKLPKK